MSWRDAARPVVAKALSDGRREGLSGAALKKFVSSRYPFGERAMHPYKVWLDEVKRQMGARPIVTEDLSSYWHDVIGGKP